MGKVFAPPGEAGPAPDCVAVADVDAWLAQEAAYVRKIVAWAKANGRGPERGEEIRFPIGDGYACYVVLSLKPVQLIHLPVGDAWQYQYAHRLTAHDIRAKIAQGRFLTALFGGCIHLSSCERDKVKQ
mgnify:CR=1 FL=1